MAVTEHILEGRIGSAHEAGLIHPIVFDDLEGPVCFISFGTEVKHPVGSIHNFPASPYIADLGPVRAEGNTVLSAHRLNRLNGVRGLDRLDRLHGPAQTRTRNQPHGICSRVITPSAVVCESGHDLGGDSVLASRPDDYGDVAEAGVINSTESVGMVNETGARGGAVNSSDYISPVAVHRVALPPGMDLYMLAGYFYHQNGKPSGIRINVLPFAMKVS